MSYPGVDDIETKKELTFMQVKEEIIGIRCCCLLYSLHIILHTRMLGIADSRLPKCPTIGD